jgi:hypothetical protein
MMKKWLISNDKYASNSKEQLEFEEDVIALTALACTPLSLVEHEAFVNLILKRDPGLNMISRTRLSRNVIPKKNRRDSQKCARYVDPCSSSLPVL